MRVGSVLLGIVQGAFRQFAYLQRLLECRRSDKWHESMRGVLTTTKWIEMIMSTNPGWQLF
jgi:hypothetical protein